LVRFAHVDDRDEAHLLDVRNGFSFGGAGARHRRLQTGEVGDAGNVLPGNAGLRGQAGGERCGERGGERSRAGGPSPSPSRAPHDSANRYSCTCTVTGERMRAVMSVPAGSVAALRSPAMTTAVPPPAPVAAPIAAPLPPPMIAPRIAPATAPPPTFAALPLPGASPSR